MGQIVNLRPIVNRPGAGPWKLFWRGRQLAPHRIHLDVIGNPLKLRLVADHPIKALVLPERLPGEAQNSVALPGSESLERLHHLGNLHQRSHQEMNVVRHHDIGVKLVVSQVPLSIANGSDHHVRDLRPAKVQRTSAGGVENAVHRQEGLSGSGCRGETAIRRKAAVQAPGEEDGLSDGMIMRQPATMECSHAEEVGGDGKNSQQSRQADWQSAADCQSAPQCPPAKLFSRRPSSPTE